MVSTKLGAALQAHNLKDETGRALPFKVEFLSPAEDIRALSPAGDNWLEIPYIE